MIKKYIESIMNIYLVERTDKWSYDDYDAFVCFANSEDEARQLSPDEYHVYKEDGWHWKKIDGTSEKCKFDSWVDDISTLKVWQLSRSPKEPTVILASFNAG